MTAMPKEIFDLVNDPEASKTIATISKEGRIHTIFMGSLMAFTPETLVFARILTKKTHQNLERTMGTGELVSLLVTKGYMSFEIVARVKAYETSGPDVERMDAALEKMGVKKTMESMGMKLLGVWSMEPVEIWNQGPGPQAGTRIV